MRVQRTIIGTVLGLSLLSTGSAPNTLVMGGTQNARLSPSSVASPKTVEFNRDIRPILSDKCFTCHGPDQTQRRTAFHFDVEESAKQDIGGGHFAIVPGDPANSVLIQRITSPDEALRMPRGGPPLSEREVALLTDWIREGAKWEKHWSFIPPKRPELPQVSDSSWARSPIDYFV